MTASDALPPLLPRKPCRTLTRRSQPAPYVNFRSFGSLVCESNASPPTAHQFSFSERMCRICANNDFLQPITPASPKSRALGVRRQPLDPERLLVRNVENTIFSFLEPD